MSQHSLIPQANNGSSVDRARLRERAPSGPTPAASAPVAAYLDDLHESGSASRSHPFAEDRMTLAFQHLDVVLAIAARGAGQAGATNASLNARCLHAESVSRAENDVRLGVADGVDGFDAARGAPAAGNPDDPVIKRLSDALAATELADDRHTGICADALRLAIVTRMLGLQSETQRSDGQIAKAPESYPERPLRALQKWRLRGWSNMSTIISPAGSRCLIWRRVAGLSRMHFASQFRAATGFRPHEYLLRRRIQRSEELLRQSPMSLVEIALTVGFQTQAHFTTVFKRFVGDTPYQWRNAHCATARRAK